MKEVIFFSQIRSIHNAITQWYSCNTNVSVVSYNMVRHLSHKNDLNSHCVDNVPFYIKYFDNQKLVTCYKMKHEYTKKNFHTIIEKHKPQILIKKYENQDLSIIKPDKTNIYVIRDPYNWIASILAFERFPKLNINFDKKFRSLIQWYINSFNYCRENYILIINSSALVTKEKYRKHIANILELPSYNYGLDKITIEGSGSSFLEDNKKLPQEMKILERYKKYVDDSRFWNIFKEYKELKEINSFLQAERKKFDGTLS